MEIIDSHHHLWDWAVLGMPDFPAGMEVLKDNYLPADFEKELNSVGVSSSVLVGGYPPSFDKHRWYFDVAEEYPYIAGIVAWVDMLCPETAAAQLDELERKSTFVGIRHILDLEPDADWMLQDSAMVTFRELAKRKIPFDMCVNSSHLKNLLTLLSAIPDLQLVIDHIGKPPISMGQTAVWEECMRSIAQHSSAFCKLSGMIEEADWEGWTVEDLRPYVDKVLEMFGTERLMFGSNWPVCRVAGEYRDVFDACHRLLAHLPMADKQSIFANNAKRFYRLEIPTGSY